MCIQIDNVAAIRLIQHPQFYRRTKHIELKVYYLRDVYQRGDVDIKFVPSEQQRADWLTKGLNKSVFLKQRSLSNLSAWQEKA
jgi:hypothetical protein